MIGESATGMQRNDDKRERGRETRHKDPRVPFITFGRLFIKQVAPTASSMPH